MDNQSKKKESVGSIYDMMRCANMRCANDVEML